MGADGPTAADSRLSSCPYGDSKAVSVTLSGAAAGVVTRKKSTFRVALENHTVPAAVTFTKPKDGEFHTMP
jgi:hypothetical protein